MAALVFLNREPLEFAAGDTLAFNRYLNQYLPSAGWALQYEIRGDIGGGPVPEFNSVADPTGSFHVVTVLPLVTSAWQPGFYILAGYAVNAANANERHLIYQSDIHILPNLNSGANDANVSTHAQRMIPLMEAQLEAMALHPMEESSIENTKILREKRLDLTKQLAYYKEVRRNEIALNNVQNGQPSGNKIVPQAMIVNSGPFPGSSPSWPFSQ